MSDIKIGFVTCVQIGLSCMDAIYKSGGSLSMAITLNDDQAVKKSGRVYLDKFCTSHSIPLVKSKNVNDQVVIDAIKSSELDWLFIIGWSQIALSLLLKAPSKGVLGAHPTLLPIGRGRAAIPWAILKDLKETGVTLFKLDHGVDTGPIAIQKIIEIKSGCTAEDLYQEVDIKHVEIIKEAIPLLLKDNLLFKDQNDDDATIWSGRSPKDGEIDLQGSVYEAERLVRAITHPYPGAFIHKDGKKIVIWKAVVTDNSFKGQTLDFSDGVLGLIYFNESPEN